MELTGSQLDVTSADFLENCEFHLNLKAELENRVNKVSQGGSERAVLKHRERGKFLARERIEKIMDDGSAFLELSTLAADQVYEEDVPSAGIVTGIGKVC